MTPGCGAAHRRAAAFGTHGCRGSRRDLAARRDGAPGTPTRRKIRGDPHLGTLLIGTHTWVNHLRGPQDVARGPPDGIPPLIACCTWPMRTRRPEGAAGTASDGPRPAAAADVQLRLLAFAGTVDGRLGVQSQVQLCCSSAGPRRSQKSHVLACQDTGALARGRGSSSALAVAAWLCTQPHVACLALQASPERGRSKEQLVWHMSELGPGMASAQITYKRCAYSAHHAHTTVYRTCTLCSLG